MSEASDDDELERIRERKKARLKDETSSPVGESAGDSTGSDEPVHVDGQDHFREVVAEGGVVLADFHADWCGPCQMLEPIVADLAASTDATVAKVDVDANQGLAREHSVQGVPTLLLFVDGELVERRVGVQDESALRELVEQHG